MNEKVVYKMILLLLFVFSLVTALPKGKFLFQFSFYTKVPLKSFTIGNYEADHWTKNLTYSNGPRNGCPVRIIKFIIQLIFAKISLYSKQPN